MECARLKPPPIAGRVPVGFAATPAPAVVAAVLARLRAIKRRNAPSGAADASVGFWLDVFCF